MKNMICKGCGSTAIRSINVGFNGWFLFFWLGFLASAMLHWSSALAIFLALAGLKTVFAFFQWKRVCSGCKSGDIIPANSPIGRKLLSETQAG